MPFLSVPGTIHDGAASLACFDHGSHGCKCRAAARIIIDSHLGAIDVDDVNDNALFFSRHRRYELLLYSSFSFRPRQAEWGVKTSMRQTQCASHQQLKPPNTRCAMEALSSSTR